MRKGNSMTQKKFDQSFWHFGMLANLKLNSIHNYLDFCRTYGRLFKECMGGWASNQIFKK